MYQRLLSCGPNGTICFVTKRTSIFTGAGTILRRCILEIVLAAGL